MKRKLRTQHCKNCEFDFRIDLPQRNFCPNCGQENHSHRQPFFHYAAELIEGFFHLDNKTWLTIKTLLVHPGKITRDFTEDKRARYSPAVRMYIWSTAFFTLSFWLVIDIGSRVGTDPARASKSMSQRFDELPDTLETPISITGVVWPTLPPTPIREQRALKKIPDDQIGGWLTGHGFSANFINVQLIKAHRARISSSLSQSDYMKKLTTGNNLVYVLLLPLEALLLFPVFYRKKLFYLDSMMFAMHVNTWFALFNGAYLWIAMLLVAFLKAPVEVFYLMFLFNAVYWLVAIRNAFSHTWPGALLRWIPALFIDNAHHIILTLLVAAWFVR